MLWFTSDLHLGHGRMIRYAHRPFSSADEMDEVLIGSINARVGPDDDLWVLGDFAMASGAQVVRAYRERILCQHVRLVHGNHDPHLPEQEWRRLYEFDGGYYDGLRSPSNRRIVLCHYVIADWNGQRRGSLMLHGHIHSEGPAYNERNRARGLLRYDVGVDANGYAPVSVEDIERFFAGVDPVPDESLLGDGA